MAIKDLLVAYQGDEGARTALKFALQMGKKYGAVVTGAYVHASNQYDGQDSRWIPDSIRDMIRTAEREATAEVKSTFRASVAELGPDIEHDWVATTGGPSLTLARMSRFYDILITGQFEGAISHGGRAFQPEETIQRSGRPMLIVPEKYEVRPFKEVAVVAWDGSSSAARALADAMQVLETKRKLYVVTVEGGTRRIAPLTDHDITKHLRRHGIDAESVNLESTSNVGEAILDFCARVDPDILVMGAFGRAKLRALLFGGVARYVLEHQNVPVLMSH